MPRIPKTMANSYKCKEIASIKRTLVPRGSASLIFTKKAYIRRQLLGGYIIVLGVLGLDEMNGAVQRCEWLEPHKLKVRCGTSIKKLLRR
jgi:hypothetical protein